MSSVLGSILVFSDTVWGTADEAVLNNLHKNKLKNPPVYVRYVKE